MSAPARAASLPWLAAAFSRFGPLLLPPHSHPPPTREHTRAYPPPPREPEAIDWASVGADYVVESTGVFTTVDKVRLGGA